MLALAMMSLSQGLLPGMAHAENAARCERPDRLKFSFVPQSNGRNDAELLAPLLEELEEALRMPVDVVQPSSYGTAIEGLLAGMVHVARLGPASYVSAHRSDPAVTPFATVMYRDELTGQESASYNSLLITRQKGPERSIEALRGKSLVLVDPDSTSGALIPRHVFSRQLGSSLERYFGRLGYTGTQESSVLAVLNREADAAFVGSSNLAATIANGKVRRDDIRILWKSEPIPFDPFVYRGQLCADIKRKIRNVFLQSKSSRHTALLTNLRAVRLVPARDEDYRIIRDLQR
ncbi:phosphate/phosphite/phosphonate ABC transporter substrate-binding protein [Herbaspirillum lusitanum]|uniref:Phosphate/phosphite/phosphonate ABC transporter substrate-binding protein n=2 Tax=Herbaspirillum lusitanum TaxID=213312 RepID=A0ABW9AHN1_9BURK